MCPLCDVEVSFLTFVLLKFACFVCIHTPPPGGAPGFHQEAELLLSQWPLGTQVAEAGAVSGGVIWYKAVCVGGEPS